MSGSSARVSPLIRSNNAAVAGNFSFVKPAPSTLAFSHTTSFSTSFAHVTSSAVRPACACNTVSRSASAATDPTAGGGVTVRTISAKAAGAT